MRSQKIFIKPAAVLAFATAFTIFFAPMQDALAAVEWQVNPDRGNLRIEDLKTVFPEGYYWNHIIDAPEEYVDYTQPVFYRNSMYDQLILSDTPCSYHPTDGTFNIGEANCNMFYCGVQCDGFANLMGYLYHPLSGKIEYNEISFAEVPVSEVMPGDVIRINNDTYAGGHTIFVTSVYDGPNGSNTLVNVGECNYFGGCEISWGREYDLTRYDIKYVWRPVIDASNYEIFRLFNPKDGAHIYTVNAYEKRTLRELGWQLEDSPGQSADSFGVAVYRMKNPNTGEYLFTADTVERDVLSAAGWWVENGGQPAFYGDYSGRGVYRLFNPGATSATDSHHFTLDQNEIDTLVNKYGWLQDNGGQPVYFLN